MPTLHLSKCSDHRTEIRWPEHKSMCRSAQGAFDYSKSLDKSIARIATQLGVQLPANALSRQRLAELLVDFFNV